jgi:RNA polymerase sigma factor (sigma-70 family)
LLEPEEYCRRLSPRLVGALRLQLGQHQLAQEIAQEALARTWERWDSVSSMDRPEAWTFKVAFNLAASERRRRFAGVRAWRRHGNPLPEEPLTDDRLVLADALAALPARQREAVILRYYAQYSTEEAALVMGCAKGTVKALCSQGLARLRDLLGDSRAVAATKEKPDA